MDQLAVLSLIPGLAAGVSQAAYTAIQGARGLGKSADIGGALIIAALAAASSYGGLVAAGDMPSTGGPKSPLSTQDIATSAVTAGVLAGLLSFALSHVGSEGTKKSLALHALGKGALQLVAVSAGVAVAHKYILPREGSL